MTFMKKLSDDKNTTWIAYVQSGKLTRYLENLKLAEVDVQSILDKMGGRVYKDDYQMLTKCLGAEAMQKLNGAIRSANYAAKNNIVNLRVKAITHERLVTFKDLIDADSIDDTVYYLTSKNYDDDTMIEDALEKPSLQALGNIHGSSFESLLYKRLQGLDKRVFAHHYLKSVAPQLAIRARRSPLLLSQAKAFRKAKQLGIEPTDLWALDFGDQRRKMYPIFQLNDSMTNIHEISKVKDEALNFPDQLWFEALVKNLWLLESNNYKHIDLFFDLLVRDANAELESLCR
jgi:hypothetical protein